MKGVFISSIYHNPNFSLAHWGYSHLRVSYGRDSLSDLATPRLLPPFSILRNDAKLLAGCNRSFARAFVAMAFMEERATFLGMPDKIITQILGLLDAVSWAKWDSAAVLCDY